jgi:hypothetical protein
MCDFCGGDHETPKITNKQRKLYFQCVVKNVIEVNQFKSKVLTLAEELEKARNLKNKSKENKVIKKLNAMQEEIIPIFFETEELMMDARMFTPNYKDN